MRWGRSQRPSAPAAPVSSIGLVSFMMASPYSERLSYHFACRRAIWGLLRALRPRFDVLVQPEHIRRVVTVLELAVPVVLRFAVGPARDVVGLLVDVVFGE